MFKNLWVYRLSPSWAPSFAALEAGLQAGLFTPCAASQPLSAGWVPPRGEAHGPLVESVQGQWLLRLQIEKKLLPSAVVKRRVADLAEHISQTTGRKPGKKQQRDLKAQAVLELLPQAFSQTSQLPVWLNPQAGLLLVDSPSASRTEEVLTLLVKSVPGFAALPLQTALSPASAMADWLASGQAPQGFTVDQECELKSTDESRAVVRYARHPLDIDEVRAHIAAGKRPTRLALTWQGRVSCVLTELLQLKKISFGEVVFDSQAAQGDDSGFDADAALATGELAPLVEGVIEALGGEAEAAPSAPSAPSAPLLAPATAQPPAPPAAVPDEDPPPWA